MRLKTVSILCLCAGLVWSNLAFAQFIPSSGIGGKLPGETKNPKFKRGDSRINFFIEGEDLQSMVNPELSTACVLGEFNQIKRNRYYVNIRMPDDRVKRFGYVKGSDNNLRDPNNLKAGGEIYIFDLDGTSECRVFSMPGGG